MIFRIDYADIAERDRRVARVPGERWRLRRASRRREEFSKYIEILPNFLNIKISCAIIYLNMALPCKFHKAMEQLYWDAYADLDSDDSIYLLTWNPKPRFYNYDHNGDNDYVMQWMTMLRTLLKSLRCLSKYAFVAEISDVGKLHIHGFLTIADKVKYHRSFLPSLRNNGFIKISKLKKLQRKSVKYHVKDIKETRQYFISEPDLPYVLTHENDKVVNKMYHRYVLFIKNPDEPKEVLKKRNVMCYLEFLSEED